MAARAVARQRAAADGRQRLRGAGAALVLALALSCSAVPAVATDSAAALERALLDAQDAAAVEHAMGALKGPYRRLFLKFG